MKKPIDPDVAEVFQSYPPRVRRRMTELRKLILETAAATEGVGEIEETLKWGEPAYVTSQSKSGSTIRMAWKANAPNEYALCFHCQTNLVEKFRLWFPGTFEFDGNRRIVLEVNEPLPVESLSVCIAAALTYHRDKKLSRI